MADFVKVATTNEIEPCQARCVDVRGKSIALFNVEGQFFAIFTDFNPRPRKGT